MNKTELRLALNTLPFLDSHGGANAGMVEMRVRPKPRRLVWHPDAVATVFRNDRQMGREGSDTLRPLVGASSLLWAEGARHTALRQVLGQRLRGRGLSAYHDLISMMTESSIDRLEPADTIGLADWTRSVLLRIIGRIVLGEVPDDHLARFGAWMDSALGSRGRLLAFRYLRLPLSVSSPWRTFLRTRVELKQLLLPDARCEKGLAPTTLAGVLLAGAPPLDDLDEAEIWDQVVTLLFAGHETTASAIAWTLYWLTREDDVRHSVLDELASTSDSGADAGQVPLLDAVCRESLRLSPPATVAGHRILTEELDVMGETLPAGSAVTPCIYLAHRRADRYPRPHRVDPHRFLNRHVSAQDYFPFGGGIRRCLGADLAMTEMRMVTAAVLRRRTLHCVNPAAATPQLRGPAMAPSSALRMAMVAACHS